MISNEQANSANGVTWPYIFQGAKMQFQNYGQRENILGILDPDVLWYKSSILSFSFGQTFEMVFDLVLSERHHLFNQTIASPAKLPRRTFLILK